MNKFIALIAVAFAVLISAAISTTVSASNNHPERDRVFDCTVQTERPHASSGYDQVSVKGFTKCATAKDFMLVETTLYVHDGSRFRLAGATAITPPVYGGKRTPKARSHTQPCENGRYKGLSMHLIIDDGETRKVWTQNERTVTTC